MNRYPRIYTDVDCEGGWVAVGLAWCETATVPIGPSHLRLIADSGCDVRVLSLN